MEYRAWKKQNGAGESIRTSLLGYGCMRFPTTPEGAIDEPRAEALLNAARDAGVNYFDTAYPYHGGQSEPFVGRVIAKWPRESFYLATKMPLWQCGSLEEAQHIAEGVKGKKLAIPMYILVSSHALQMAQRMGIADVLAEAGAEIIADSCPDQPCWHYLKGKVGITESPKCAYYPRRRGIHFIIRDLDTCIQAALTGEVK